MIKKIDDIIINGSLDKPIPIDVSFKDNNIPKDVVIFCHGFKGFKDWGPFNDIATRFAENDMFFIKFNFSFNGTTINNPTEFDDLKAFGNNNFTTELNDLDKVINWLSNNNTIDNNINHNKISLFGHSRGGGISILKANEDTRIYKLVSWASPSNFLNRLPKMAKLETWKNAGVAYIYNGRTKQNMPMYYQFYLDCQSNLLRLNIENAVKNINIPFLIVHGTNDTTVDISNAYDLKKWNPDAKLHIVDEADHVLGAFHPYNLEDFPYALNNAINKTISFLKD